MTIQELLQKYNVPVPRYTSYPPANFFGESFTDYDYVDAINASNETGEEHLSFYIHIPFCLRMCHYCGCNSYPAAKGDGIDKYVAALHREINMVADRLDPSRKIAQIHYGGGTPTILPPQELRELNEHLLYKFQTIPQPEIAIECHPGYLAESSWSELASTAYFNRFSLGIQDFDEKVLKTVNRQKASLPFETICAIIRQYEGRINMDFLYGLPHQTAESFANTITRAVELQPDRLVTFSYAHVPWVNKHQLILEKAGLPSGEEKNRMYEVARAILCKEDYQPIGLDHFVKKDDELYTALQNGQLHRNFQGYCSRRTTGQVYAFGVSGISQLGTAYAQNTKDISQYIEQIEKDIYPTVKGYWLNTQEQITREVIETLMCNYRIDWKELSGRLDTEVDRIKEDICYDEDKLREFAADGIIEFDNDQIQITPEGTLFVRNVAASFDRLLINSNKSFSKPV